jgi:hypothetical protein
MTNEQINAAIAKACDIVGKDKYGPIYKTPDGWVVDCPKFATDLNAMHEAEQHLWSRNYYLRYDYIYDLGTLLNLHNPGRMEANDMLDATARQRAEALLRTLGKWEEGK